MRIYIIGADGNVGSVIAEACAAEGWEVANLDPDDALPTDAGAILVDAGPAGHTGYEPATWSNYYGAVERAVRIIGEADRNGFAAVMLCSTPWIAVRTGDPYSDSKALIEDIARSHNRHGKCFVLVDRIGMQHDAAVDPSRFELSVRQRPGQLGERIVASLLQALNGSRAAL